MCEQTQCRHIHVHTETHSVVEAAFVVACVVVIVYGSMRCVCVF